IDKSNGTKDGSVIKWTVTVTNTYAINKTVWVYDPNSSLVSETCLNIVTENPGDYYSCEVPASSSALLVLSTVYPGHADVCQPLDLTNTPHIAHSNTYAQ